jgi:glutaminase
MGEDMREVDEGDGAGGGVHAVQPTPFPLASYSPEHIMNK